MTTARRARALLLSALEGALASVDVRARTAAALAGGALGDGPIDVIAAGKAAPAMMRGAIDALGSRIARGLVVRPDVVRHAGFPRRVRVLVAAHPVPDARSVRAAHAALAMAKSSRGPLVVLVSGGASSLLCAPSDGLTLARKRRLVAALLHRSIPVDDVNCVRAHLSRIKGGRLLAAAGERNVLTLVISDVIGGTAADVGSGPSVPRRPDRARAERILRRAVPALAGVSLDAVPSFPRARVRSSPSEVLARPEELASRAALWLRAHGVAARVLPPFTGTVDALALEYARLATRLPPHAAWVRVAEPHLAVTAAAPGRGGRSTHLGACLSRTLPRGVMLLAAATDGVDGASGTGGALVTRVPARSPRRHALDDALARFDTGTWLAAAGCAVPGRATGHNLADLHVLFRFQ